MRLFFFALLALTSVGLSNGSNLTFFGAPRASLDPVLPVLSIEESYIRAQTDGTTNTVFGAADIPQCSASNPCADGSCCNLQGHCGYRDVHCKVDCVANCDAKAPCGVNSEDGKQKCPLNLCCSYFGFCGASDAFCRDITNSGKSTPCQKDFGTCGTVSTQSTPSCGKGSGTASRRVAYYEGWNIRRRPCDKVWPADIDTAGLTHLIFSFATINPTTFAVAPMHPDDESLYADFIGLKDGSQKWIGIGGWEFSDAGATRYTWSQMASSKASRQAFIASLLEFLDKWNFQGVDIDWEWPGAETRGGNPAIDKSNQVDLMKELREALGSRGLSTVMPAQYEYLKNIDPKAIESDVDFFNVLAYDLHGPWDRSISSLGAHVKPHTDLKEIDTALDLFWSDNVTPAKINLGIANYGRGYFLDDEKCAKYDCAWTGPSKAGECTKLAGVLSQCEIQRLISSKNLKPVIVAGGAGVKQIVFDGQWVGYDDSETLGLKQELANNRCLGGTALWAIDYASCGRSDPDGPGTPQSSSAAAPSAPAGGSLTTSKVQSVPVGSLSVAPSAPATSSTLVQSSASMSSVATSAASTTLWVIQSSASPSVPASSAVSPALPPAQSSQAGSSVPAPASSTSSKTQSSAAPPTAVPIVPPVGSSTPASSAPETSAPVSPAVSSTVSPLTSSIASSLAPSAQSSQAGSLSLVPTSSAAQPSSQISSTLSSSQAASSGAPPVVVVPSLGSSHSRGTMPTSTVSSATVSSSVSTLQQVTSSVLSSGGSAPTSIDATSSVPVLSGSSSVSKPTSSLTSWASSTNSQTSLTSSTVLGTSGTSPTMTSAPMATTGTITGWVSSSAVTPSFIGSSLVPSSATGSSIVQSSQISSGTTTLGKWSSTSQSRSGTIIGTPSQSSLQSFGSTSPNASSSQASSHHLASSQTSSATVSTASSIGGSFGITSSFGHTSGAVLSSTAQTSLTSRQSSTAAPSGTQGGSNIITSSPNPTSDAFSIQTREHTTTDHHGNTVIIIITNPSDDDDKHNPTNTKPSDDDKDPDDNSDPTTSKPDSDPTSKPYPSETPPEQMKGCVPNDCVADCASWHAVTLFVFKRPFCPCKVVTCESDDDEDDWTDSDSDGEDDDCKLLGCGCGWMGLPFGPGCDIDIEIDFPNLFPMGIFGPEPCKFFGGCPPGTGPPPGPGGTVDSDCGPLGCDGYCNTEKGCDPCPPEICNPPQCPIPTGCGPKPGPNPKPNTKRPSKCDEDQKTTVTDKIVHCTENIKLEPTTIASLNFTLSTTLTSTCWTPVLHTYTGCGVLGTSTTKTMSSFTTTSSSAPMCSHAPLDLNNDEGDNEQPPRTTDGPACTHAPLSLDDDQGDNEMPVDMSLSLSMSFSPTPSANSSSFSSSPTSTTDSPRITSSSSLWSSSSSVSRVPPPSILSESFTGFPWGTGIPSGTPAVNCPTCDQLFKDYVQMYCPDGSNAEACAKWALSALCYGSHSADYCKKGPCKPAACPKENPGDFEKGEPAISWTTTLSLASTTLIVTATPTLVSLPIGPTPTCNAGHGVSPTGKWTLLIEHEIKERPDNATFTWRLWDENGCFAGQDSASNQILGRNISTDIGAFHRDQYKMGYALHTYVTESLSTSRSEIEFVISKPVLGCKSDCWTKWKISNPQESKPYQIHSDCTPECGSRNLDTDDISCDDGINKFHDNGVGSVQKRGGFCTFRMPFQPKDDSARPPPKPFTGDSRWTLSIRQFMEYDQSEIEWTLTDPNGEFVGTDLWDTSNANPYSGVVDTRGRDDHPETNMRYKMKLTVGDPRSKDDTTVQLTYLSLENFEGCRYDKKVVGEMPGCRPTYRTETNNQRQQSSLNDCYGVNPYTGKTTVCPKPMLSNMEFSCDPVPNAFYPKGAGFERKFKCWWPHDFVKPWDGLPRPSDELNTMALGGMNETSSAMGVNAGINGSWMNVT